jgi:hypothetical protein
MTDDLLLCDLLSQGFHLSVVGNSLRIEPREKITDKHRAVIRQHKHSLLALLVGKNADTLPATQVTADLWVTVSTPMGTPITGEFKQTSPKSHGVFRGSADG